MLEAIMNLLVTSLTFCLCHQLAEHLFILLRRKNVSDLNLGK